MGANGVGNEKVTGQGTFSTRTKSLPVQTFSNVPSPNELSVSIKHATD